MSAGRNVVFWCVLAFIVSAFIICWIQLRRSPELSSKPENSLLQALEAEYKGRDIDKRAIVEHRDGYCAIGILSDNRRQRIWVLLNPKHEPLVKITSSKEDFHITNGDLEQLKGECEINPAVTRVLRQHIYDRNQ